MHLKEVTSQAWAYARVTCKDEGHEGVVDWLAVAVWFVSVAAAFLYDYMSENDLHSLVAVRTAAYIQFYLDVV